MINKIIFVVLFFLSLFIFFNYVLTYVAPFLIAYFLFLILNPLADLLTIKLKFPRWFSSFVCILLVIFLVSFVGTSLFARIITEGQSFATNIPKIIEDSTSIIEKLQQQSYNLINLIPEDFKKATSDLFSNFASSLTSSVGTFFKNMSLNVFTKVPQIFMGIVFTLLSCFFMLSDKDLLTEKYLNKTPYWIKKNQRLIKKGVFSALIGYVKAQLIIMSVVATIVIISLSLLRYPYALLIGLVIAVIDALPIFGAGFILWPWGLTALIAGNYSEAIWIFSTYGIVFLTRQFLEPRVLGKQIGVHPILSLMSIYIGLKVYGGFGFILGPITLILLKTVIESEDATL